MACLMNRTPCCRAISPSSCGSMMTKRDLSYSKCRSISGKVPLPIEPKPIMTMGPEIFAWIGAAGGLMGLSPDYGCVCRKGNGSGTPFGSDFDLDLHLGLIEPGDDEEGCGGADLAKPFAADREHGVGILGIGDIIGRADNISHRKAAFLQRSLDRAKAVPGLAGDIRGHRHGGVVVAGGSGNEGEIAIDDGAAVAGRLFKRRAGGNQT